MANKDTHTKPKSHKLSELERFRLDFEYDVSWRDAKKAVRERTHKS